MIDEISKPTTRPTLPDSIDARDLFGTKKTASGIKWIFFPCQSNIVCSS